jgi:hypothetical protein
MNLNKVLADISNRGVKRWAEGEQLRLRALRGRLTPDLCNVLAENNRGYPI